MADAESIPARVRAWRTRRGMSQQQFADMLGRHVTWVKKFEAGDRQADPRVSLLVEIARVLDVSLDTLLTGEHESAAASPPEEREVAALRAALLQPVDTERRQLETQILHRQVIYGYDAYQAGNYAALSRLLPNLISDARAAADARSDDPVVVHALTDTYHLTAIALIKLGDSMSAWHAADRSLSTAEQLADPVAVALAAQALAYAATGIGQAPAGIMLIRSVLDRVSPALSMLGDDGWTAIGMLQLKAAVAAAGTGNAALTRDMINAARTTAQHVPVDANVRRTGFNTTNVLLYEASVLGQLGDHPGALRAATAIHPFAFAALPRERRTHHLVETAGSALAISRTDSALAMLLSAERDNPQEIHRLPMARAIVAGLVDARRGPADQQELRALARRAGVTG
jgi:transcriptional regulator with XRE-family HTH domain